MAGKLIEYSDLLLGTLTKFWRELPADLGIAGPFSLLYTDIESSAVPSKNQGNKPWGRLTLQITNGMPTNIRATKYRVEGTITLQIFAAGQRTSNALLVKRVALAMQDKIAGFRASNIILTDVNAVTALKQDGYYAAGVRADLFWYERRSVGTNSDKPSVFVLGTDLADIVLTEDDEITAIGI